MVIKLFDVRTQVQPEQFSTLTRDLQVIQATATVKDAMVTALPVPQP